MKRAAVLGATGYSGIELLRLLRFHSQVEVVAVSADKNAGRPVDQVIPSLRGFYALTCKKIDELATTDPDVVFLALPAEQSASVCQEFLKKNTVVIDISAAFRLKDTALFKHWYGIETPAQLAQTAVYGLPELKRELIKHARLIANPGCYPTGAIIPLAPFLREGIISGKGIIIDAKSGVTGAGRSPSQELHFSEVSGGFRAYKPAAHRHIPEIEQELSAMRPDTHITFVPHLVPVNRGILTTIYASVNAGRPTQRELEEILSEAYGNEPFVRILRFPDLPDIHAVTGSNYIDISVRFDEKAGTIILFSAIDNLVKGAAGQAVQNMNIIYGFDETLGLTQPPVFP